MTEACELPDQLGGSLRDVHMLSGHSALSTTQRYIEVYAEAQRSVVDLV
jgi:integrase/recombinase XerD